MKFADLGIQVEAITPRTTASLTSFL